ncbi:hypothetical protein DYB32_005112 [Aphanomyces invadans]|uniref:Uncharacterized protein n=1 Tax=Aphanomyces invadans TaxID=157072 RepID=A0A418AVI0_9STRA|nr:hypothetical protein DYB32_005112 [Aphanomyces invadans]
MLKQFMVMRELEGEPKDLKDKVLEEELRKIVGMPKNGVEADITNLFYGIHMDMKDDDVMNLVVKFLANYEERMDVRVMKAHLKRPDMRKKILKRLLDHLDPDAVRDACVLEMDHTRHDTEFDWAAISKLIMLHAKEQQRLYSTYGAGRKKPNAIVRNVRGKASATEVEEDHETDATHPTTVVTHRVTDAATRETVGNVTKAASAIARCLRCDQADHSFDKCSGSTSEERAKIFYEWKPILTRHKQWLKTTKHARKCQATAQWAKDEEIKREANSKRIADKHPKMMRRLFGSTGEETMATINDVIDVSYCPDSGSDIGIIPMTVVLRRCSQPTACRVHNGDLDDKSKSEIDYQSNRLPLPYFVEPGHSLNLGAQGIELGHHTCKHNQALKVLDNTVRPELLSKPWIGQVVGQTSITFTETVDLSVTLHTAAGQVKLPGKYRCYVVDSNDELIVSKHLPQSIGLDMSKLLEQVTVRQGEGDGDGIGDHNESEYVTFDICVRNLHDMNKQLDAEDMSAAEHLFELAMKTNPTLVAGDAVQRDQLKMVVIDAAASGVWRSKFRGTDPPADVDPMEIRLKSHRCKPRKMNSLTSMFVEAFGKQHEQENVIYSILFEGM